MNNITEYTTTSSMYPYTSKTNKPNTGTLVGSMEGY